MIAISGPSNYTVIKSMFWSALSSNRMGVSIRYKFATVDLNTEDFSLRNG